MFANRNGRRNGRLGYLVMNPLSRAWLHNVSVYVLGILIARAGSFRSARRFGGAGPLAKVLWRGAQSTIGEDLCRTFVLCYHMAGAALAGCVPENPYRVPDLRTRYGVISVMETSWYVYCCGILSPTCQGSYAGTGAKMCKRSALELSPS